MDKQDPALQARVDDARAAMERGEWCIEIVYGDKNEWCDTCLRSAKLEVSCYVIDMDGVSKSGARWQCVRCIEDRMRK